jgi:hypothetical protein
MTPRTSLAQAGGFGGGGQSLGGGFGGTSFSGSTGFGRTSTTGGRILGVSNGFRPSSTDPFAATRGSFGQQGGFQSGGGQFGQFGQFGQQGFGNQNQMNRNMFGNQMNNQAGSRLPTGALAETLRPLPPASFQVKARLDQLLAANTGEKEGRNIQLVADGEVMVLRGSVRDEGEKRLAESLLHLEPGVRDVRNELEVKPLQPAKP